MYIFPPQHFHVPEVGMHLTICICPPIFLMLAYVSPLKKKKKLAACFESVTLKDPGIRAFFSVLATFMLSSKPPGSLAWVVCKTVTASTLVPSSKRVPSQTKPGCGTRATAPPGTHTWRTRLSLHSEAAPQLRAFEHTGLHPVFGCS